jgi:hypothetical protein
MHKTGDILQSDLLKEFVIVLCRVGASGFYRAYSITYKETRTYCLKDTFWFKYD